MAYMSSPPIWLVFGVSLLVIIILMTAPIGFLYCYRANQPRDIETPIAVETVRPIPTERIDRSRIENHLNDKTEEVQDDIFVIGEDEEDESSLANNTSQAESSVDASISQQYFKGLSRGDERKSSRAENIDMPPSYDASTTTLDRRFMEVEAAYNAIHPLRQSRYSPSVNPSVHSCQDRSNEIGSSTAIKNRDSFDSVSVYSQGPVSPVDPKLAAPGRSLLRR
ncbi:MAG: hypothetical protein M1821_002776 [Bathelium mastoideum]|nr:MAG: hypothetical protein M1821_002776 [Bathelium mastoideum]KAI9694584.1 MAG: hypothetical protein M1822_000200 [Bathelium mastoideum]